MLRPQQRSARSLTCFNSPRPVLCDIGGISEKPLIDVAREEILALADETKFAADGIASRTLLRTANLRVVLLGFAEGRELTEHTSTQSAVVQLLSGECEFSLGGKPHAAKAEDLIYLPPNLRHAVSATKQFSMLPTRFGFHGPNASDFYDADNKSKDDHLQLKKHLAGAAKSIHLVSHRSATAQNLLVSSEAAYPAVAIANPWMRTKMICAGR